MDNKTAFPLEPSAENELNNSDVGIGGESFEFELPDVPTMTDDATGEVFTPAPRKEDIPKGKEEKKPRRRKKKIEDNTAVTDTESTDDVPKRTRRKKSEDSSLGEEKPKRSGKKKTDTPTSEPAPEDTSEPVSDPVSVDTPKDNPEPALTDNEDVNDNEASYDAPEDTKAPEVPEQNPPQDENAPKEEDAFPEEDADALDTDEDGEYAPQELIIEELSLFDEPKVVDIIPEAMPDAPMDGEHPTEAVEFVPTREERYDPEKPRRVDLIFDFIELFIFTLVAVLLATTFFVRHSVVEGESMLSTLNDGDTLIISDIFYTAERGDIVVVEDYTTLLDKPIVKRVIGIGGDHIRVREEGIYLNGKLLDESYVYTDLPGYKYNIYPTDTLVEAMKDNKTFGFEFGQYYEFVVPEGELFVLGDHRNNSTDSRVIGTVRCDAVLGKVLFRIYPFEDFGEVE